MDNISISDRWKTSLSEGLTKLIIYDFFKQNNIESKDSENSLIIGKYSPSFNPDSFLKSTFTKSSRLPAKFEIKVGSKEGKTELNIKMECLYDGSCIGKKRKYKNLFGKLTNLLKIKLFEKEREKKIRPTCPNCGARGFDNKNQKICERCGFELQKE